MDKKIATQAKQVTTLEHNIAVSGREESQLEEQVHELRSANGSSQQLVEETRASRDDGVEVAVNCPRCASPWRQTRHVSECSHASWPNSAASSRTTRYHPYATHSWFSSGTASLSTDASSTSSGNPAPADPEIPSPRDSEEKGKALLGAAERGRLLKVQQLLNDGAPVSHTSNHNWTALHFAASRGHSEVVSALVSAGAPLDARDERGMTPLHRAALNGHGKVASALAEAGAPIDAKNFKGWTPLHEAAFHGHPRCLKTLLCAGADRDAVNCKGNTALHLAASGNRQQCVFLLMNAGADTSVKNTRGDTAKDLASIPPIKTRLA